PGDGSGRSAHALHRRRVARDVRRRPREGRGLAVLGQGRARHPRAAFTAFHGFDVNAGLVDLRTIEYLFPNFPRLHGTVSGTATLDSSWLDVRFSNAHLVHQDGEGEPSQVTGSGRITDSDQLVAYDMVLNAEPLSLTMIARSY